MAFNVGESTSIANLITKRLHILVKLNSHADAVTLKLTKVARSPEVTARPPVSFWFLQFKFPETLAKMRVKTGISVNVQTDL